MQRTRRLQRTLWFVSAFVAVEVALWVVGRGALWLTQATGPIVDVDPSVGAALERLRPVLSATVAAWFVLGRGPVSARRRKASARSDVRTDSESSSAPGPEVVDGDGALASAVDQLESGYDALDLFIGDVSHELRTPIATVLAEARQILIRERSTPEYVAFVRSTGDEMVRLGRMIQSYLTLARMDWEERHTAIAPVSLLDVVVDVVRRVRGATRATGVRIVVNLPEDGDLEVHGDPELLASMVDNLVRSAVRASVAAGIVTLSMERVDDEAIIRVGHSGNPAPDRAAASAGKAGAAARASALGHVVAQKVASLHGGTLRTELSEAGGGEVTVQLPTQGRGAHTNRNEDEEAA